jgi:integrase
MKQAKHLLGKIRPLDKRIGDITTHDLNNIIDQLPKQSANHTFAMARTFFRFCVRRKLLDKSPLQDQLMPYKRNSRSRVLSNEELKSIWHACPPSSNFESIIRLLIVTGQRRGEIAALHRPG